MFSVPVVNLCGFLFFTACVGLAPASYADNSVSNEYIHKVEERKMSLSNKFIAARINAVLAQQNIDYYAYDNDDEGRPEHIIEWQERKFRSFIFLHPTVEKMQYFRYNNRGNLVQKERYSDFSPESVDSIIAVLSKHER